MVRHAGTALGSCEYEPVPHDNSLQLHVQSRGGASRPDLLSPLVVDLLDRAWLWVEIGRHDVLQRHERLTCHVPGQTSIVLYEAAQRGRENVTSHCIHQLSAHHSTHHWLHVTCHLEAAYPTRPPCSSPGINLRFSGAQEPSHGAPFSDLGEKPM